MVSKPLCTVFCWFFNHIIDIYTVKCPQLELVWLKQLLQRSWGTEHFTCWLFRGQRSNLLHQMKDYSIFWSTKSEFVLCGEGLNIIVTAENHNNMQVCGYCKNTFCRFKQLRFDFGLYLRSLPFYLSYMSREWFFSIQSVVPWFVDGFSQPACD